MEKKKSTTEAIKEKKWQTFLTVINIKINGTVQKKHKQRFIDAEYTIL